MLPSFRSAATLLQSSTTTIFTVGAPAGVASGDVLIAALALNLDATITPPSGWELYNKHLTDGLAIYTKTAGGSEPASYDWTLGTARQGAATICAYQDTDGIEAGSKGEQINRNLLPCSTGGVGVFGADRLVVRVVTGLATATVTWPTSAERVDITQSGAFASVADAAVGSGVAADEVATASANAGSLASASITLKPLSSTILGAKPYLVGSTFLGRDGTATDPVCPMPHGVEDGDFLVMVVLTFTSAVPATVAGWTLEDSFDTGSGFVTVLSKAASSEPVEYTVTTAARHGVHIFAFRDAATSYDFPHKSNASPAPTSTTYTATGVTVDMDGSLLLVAYTKRNGGSNASFSTPAGTDRLTYSEGDQATVATFLKRQVASGPTGDISSTVTAGGASEENKALLYAIRGTPAERGLPPNKIYYTKTFGAGGLRE